MTESGRYTAIYLLAAILFCMIYLSGCSESKPSSKKESAGIQKILDSSLLFDGKSLDGWEITNFGPQGPVYVSGNEIILGMGDGCTGITWKRAFPRSEYEVSLDAKRISGNDFFCGITFPVEKSPCTLIVGGWGGATVGLSSINGRDAAENETTKIMRFENGRWYHIRMTVTEKFIKSWIDSVKVVDFTIGDKKLSIRPEVELSRPFGITSWTTTAAIRDIRLTRLTRTD
jgi:hypothetical protein